jgi:hypothetical protein
MGKRAIQENVVNGFCRALQIGQFSKDPDLLSEKTCQCLISLGVSFPQFSKASVLSLCWSFKLQRQFLSVMSKGEVLAGWS